MLMADLAPFPKRSEKELEKERVLREIERAKRIKRMREEQMKAEKKEPQQPKEKVEIPKYTLKDYVGQEKLKKFLKDKVEMLKKSEEHPEIFSKYNKSPFEGVLLYGPPGTGKTFLAKCLAGEAGLPYFEIVISSILSAYVGESEQNLEGILKKAKENQPCILVFDEFDSIGTSREGSFRHGSEQITRNIVNILNTRLSEMDLNKDKILLIATTNMPWIIDPALRRSGRFTHSFYIGAPTFQERIKYLQFYLSKIPSKVNIFLVAYLTDGFSQADLRKLVDEAKDIAVKTELTQKKEYKITTRDLIRIIKEERVKPTVYSWFSSVLSSFEKNDLKVEDRITYRPMIKELINIKKKRENILKKMLINVFSYI
jgi:SpoVK/Ycf46/Vps4 family AAA+-type ATPase